MSSNASNRILADRGTAGISGRTNENNVGKDRDPYFIPGIAFVNVARINFSSFVVLLSAQCEKKGGEEENGIRSVTTLT